MGRANASGAGVSVAGDDYCMGEGECCPLYTRQVPATGTRAALLPGLVWVHPALHPR